MMADNDYAAKAKEAGLPELAKLIIAHRHHPLDAPLHRDELHAAAIAEASKRATELWMVCCDGKPKRHILIAVGERTAEERARRLCRGRNATEDCPDVWTAHRVYLGDS